MTTMMVSMVTEVCLEGSVPLRCLYRPLSYCVPLQIFVSNFVLLYADDAAHSLAYLKDWYVQYPNMLVVLQREVSSAMRSLKSWWRP